MRVRGSTIVERNPTAWTPRKKEAFRGELKRIKGGAARVRYGVILHWADGYGVRATARMLQCAVSTVVKARRRFREEGLAGLADRRGDNGRAKVTDEYSFAVQEAVEGAPQDFGHRRPTWTQELLVQTLFRRTGIRISISTMSRLLHRMGIRRGSPKPTVSCPWPEKSRKRRIRWIRRLVETLGRDEVAVYEDELDVHLNPKIGPDYMLPGNGRR